MDIEKIIKNLEKNNMKGYFVKSSDEARELVAELLKKGDTISCGGSVTLADTGIDKLMRSGDYNFLDRSVAGLTAEQIDEIYAKTFMADAYLCSANAVTENGELVNVDGRSNRVAAIVYGPKSVICVVGVNKIVPDVKAGFKRVKEIAAPLNAKRLGCNTPCAKTGKCIALDGDIADGCQSSARICASYVVSGRQRVKDRIKVIIVDEKLGY
ncbi:MAG: lactate utilization protein [Ruminococcaceae bacterium]|nr:lactate utilization protein [Oscillospiraceae bacterium]